MKIQLSIRKKNKRERMKYVPDTKLSNSAHKAKQKERERRGEEVLQIEKWVPLPARPPPLHSRSLCLHFSDLWKGGERDGRWQRMRWGGSCPLPGKEKRGQLFPLLPPVK